MLIERCAKGLLMYVKVASHRTVLTVPSGWAGDWGPDGCARLALVGSGEALGLA